MMPKGCVISTLGDNEISNDDLQPFNVDWMKKYKGQSKVVLKPQTTSQVSQILKYCNQNLIP